MTKARGLTSYAPFARMRERGFVFRTRALRLVLTALQRAWQSHDYPLVLEGPADIGKKTMVTAWLQRQARGTVTAVRLDARDIAPDRVAEALLFAFGQKPAERASAEGALSDFLEDCVFDGRPGFIMVSDLGRDDRELWRTLLRLAKPRGEGGAGLPLCVTTEEAPAGLNTLTLPRMRRSEVEQFIQDVCERADDEPLSEGDELVDRLHKLSGGLPGRLGPALDQAMAARAVDASSPIEPAATAEPTVGEPLQKTQPGEGPTGSFDEAAGEEPADLAQPTTNPAPSPEDIEAAILAMGQEREDSAQTLTAELTPARRSISPPLARYPTIRTGEQASTPNEPANDPAEALAPRMASDLEEVAGEVAELQGHLIVVRGQAEALQTRLDERSRLRAEAAEEFAESVRDLRA